jgi:hypothetical protein
MQAKRWLYLVHRWLGIALCVVMALWFLSGMVMLYVGYPKLTTEERLQGLPPLPAAGCCVPISQALAAAGMAQGPGAPLAAARQGKPAPATISWRLTSVAGAPRYVLGDASRTLVAVDARSGQRIGPVQAADALASARSFAPGQAVQHLDSIHEDAWTHSRALDAHRPLHVVAVSDEARRWLYISSRTGEVVRDASFTERSWGWIGAWLHWLYMFRGGALNPWWTDIVIWLSVAATVATVTGLVVGVMRWRFRDRYRSGRRTPYPGRMARWHHVLGLVGGALCLTWIVSGLLSVNPWKVFDAPGPKPEHNAFAGGLLQADAALPAGQVLAELQRHGLVAKSLEWRRAAGQHLVLAEGLGGPWLLGPQGLLPQGLPMASWLPAAQAMLPRARLVSQEKISQFDAYYYAREAHTMTGQRERPLPIWRLKFDDPQQTWISIDPATGSVVQVLGSRRRADRWLFAFLHSFDLPVFLSARPLWDVWMLGFSLAGLGMGLTGVVTGIRRLRRKFGGAT